MANKRLDYDKIYELVMQCRKSGLSDRQWCLDNDIVPSTFYYWVRKLQQRACYELPETQYRSRNVSAVVEKQDIVCVNIHQDPAMEFQAADSGSFQKNTDITLQYGSVRISVPDDFSEQTLKRILFSLQEAGC